MKKVSYIIILAVVVGVGAVTSWLYVKYVRKAEQAVVVLPVLRSDITESVKVRGKVAFKDEFNLGFAESGTIGRVFVSKGQQVKAGAPLVRLNLNEKEAEIKSLEAVLAGKQSSLAKLLAGSTAEDIAVTQTKAVNAKTTLADAKNNLLDLLAEAYTVSDNVVRNYADGMIENPRTANPQLTFNTPDDSLENSVESSRAEMETALADFKQLAGSLSDSSDLSAVSESVENYLTRVRDFMTLLAAAVSKAEESTSVSATDISTWKTNVATGRTSVNTEISDLAAALEKWRAALSALDLAEKELTLKQAGTRSEDVNVADSDIAKARSDLQAAKERIARSTLYAPTAGIIKKIWLEAGEVAGLGATAISLSASGFQIEAEVSELDIVNIKPGQTATISLDAFPGQSISGKVYSIDPEELDRDGDTYYRVNFSLDSPIEGLRSGMSSDIKVDIITKTGVTAASSLAVYKRDGKEYAKVRRNNKIEEVEVQTGISDGQSVEILSGLNEGDKTVISAD